MTKSNKLRIDFDIWYADTYPRLLATLTAAFGDPDIPHDAATEAMARTYEKWDRVRQMDSPDGWTYRVAVNEAYRLIRRKKIERRLLLKSGRTSHVAGPAGEIWHLVEVLPPRQRLAVVLRHVGHLSEPDIAASMDITRGTVSATLRAAYKTLRVALDEPQLSTESTR